MIYTNNQGKQYLIYLYSEHRNTWKIEEYPFTGYVSVVDEQSKNNFIKQNGLKKVN